MVFALEKINSTKQKKKSILLEHKLQNIRGRKSTLYRYIAETRTRFRYIRYIHTHCLFSEWGKTWNHVLNVWYTKAKRKKETH